MGWDTAGDCFGLSLAWMGCDGFEEVMCVESSGF